MSWKQHRGPGRSERKLAAAPNRIRCAKRRYPTELIAMTVLAKLRHKDHGEARYYRCPNCAGWHLTSRAEQ